jgi:hypothetical protein
MKRRLILAVLGLLTAANPAIANELKASVRVDVQVIGISPDRAVSLIPALLDEATMLEARARLQKMIAAGEATLLGWPLVYVSSHERSVSETNEECRYPVEFDPPQLPGIFGRAKPFLPTWGEANPTTFETTNLGISLEVEALAGNDQRTFVLKVAGARKQQLGMKQFRKQASDLGVEGVMEQPEFLVSKITTQLSVRDGQPVLLHVSVVQKPKPYVELWILRATSFLQQNPSKE